ncbi:hypothetical protein [Natronomonas gomsonensis]|uniref:hypothetical protein n=1 Tax=Natronomonas gomsonensis TaxID=1046043 RepID=UPI0015BD9BA7|nr:hypothetical protein [Natronomonas gomsonensis]
MFGEVPIPFTGETIDFGEPGSAAATVVLLILGMTVFAMSRDIGDELASNANSFIGNLLGVNPAGDDGADSPEVV